MNKLIPLATALIACFGFIAVEAQTDRGRDPNVPCVVVTGAVNMPMRFALKEQRRVRVLDAVAFAGGWTKYATRTIRLIRTEQPCYAEAWAHKVWPDHPLKVIDLTAKNITSLTWNDEGANPYLNPGDVVLVVESDPVYVYGHVAQPQTIYFKEPLSLSKAIALAGGAVGVTKETKVVVYRAGDDRRYKEFLRVSLSEFKKHPERSPLLQRNDIIDVGPAGILIPPTSPPPKFDTPLFDRPGPLGPAPDRVKSGISTL